MILRVEVCWSVSTDSSKLLLLKSSEELSITESSASFRSTSCRIPESTSTGPFSGVLSSQSCATATWSAVCEVNLALEIRTTLTDLTQNFMLCRTRVFFNATTVGLGILVFESAPAPFCLWSALDRAWSWGTRIAEALGLVLDVNTLVAGKFCLDAVNAVLGFVVDLFDRWSYLYGSLIGLTATLSCFAAPRMSGTWRAGEREWTTLRVAIDDIVNVSLHTVRGSPMNRGDVGVLTKWGQIVVVSRARWAALFIYKTERVKAVMMPWQPEDSL